MEGNALSVDDKNALRKSLRARIDELDAKVTAVDSLPRTHSKVKHLEELLKLNKYILKRLFGEDI